MNKFFAAVLLLITPLALHASDAGRFITKVKLPSGQTVVVAEGDFEARSTGSFSLRLYDAASPGDETTFFSAGQIRARDGSIEKVVVVDLVGDQDPEVIVIVRSVGTGGYLSAQAFTIGKQTMAFHSMVEGLPATADPIKALGAANRVPK